MKIPILLLLTILTTATARCRCNSAAGTTIPPHELSNPAHQLLSIAITELSKAPTIPHFLAMTTGAMFEALQIASGRQQITGVQLDLSHIPKTEAVVYAGYAALSNSLKAAGLSNRIPVVDKALSKIGFGDTELRESIGKPIAEAIAKQYPLNLPVVRYTAPNKPSTNGDAACEKVVDPDGWQALCVTPSSGGRCVVQTVPHLPFVNASLITFTGARGIQELISRVPPPYKFDEPLSKVPKSFSAFADDYGAVIDAVERLDDREKMIAEVFAPSAAIAVHQLALDEAAIRRVRLSKSVEMFFALSAGVRDGFVGCVTVKIIYSTVRPITVLQCGYRGEKRKVWRGPYLGIGRKIGSKEAIFKTYIQTPPFPGYVSGHTTISATGASILEHYFGKKPRGGNCYIVEKGGSKIEGRIDKGEEGFIDGVTNIPNRGKDSIGYSPRKRVSICWKEFKEFPTLSGLSRLFGGVHTPLENVEGERLGRRAAIKAVRFVKEKMRQRK